MNIFTRIVVGFLCLGLCGGKVEHLDICVMLRPLAGRISRGCLILKVFVMLDTVSATLVPASR